MSKIIQISLSDSEYSEIKEAAEEAGLSIMLYAKGKILSNGEFQKYYSELLHAVEVMRNGTKFNIKAVFGLQWASIPKGIRLALGREFVKQVSANKIPYIIATCKDAAHTQWYKKLEVHQEAADRNTL